MALNALRQAKPGSTYRDVFELAKQNLLRTIEDQHPQIEGRMDREIFGVKDIVPLRFIPLSSIAEDKVVLAGGLAHGLTEGSIWQFYPPGTKQTKDTSPSGQVVITELDMLTAEGTIVEGADAISENEAVDKMIENLETMASWKMQIVEILSLQKVNLWLSRSSITANNLFLTMCWILILAAKFQSCTLAEEQVN